MTGKALKNLHVARLALSVFLMLTAGYLSVTKSTREQLLFAASPQIWLKIVSASSTNVSGISHMDCTWAMPSITSAASFGFTILMFTCVTCLLNYLVTSNWCKWMFVLALNCPLTTFWNVLVTTWMSCWQCDHFHPVHREVSCIIGPVICKEPWHHQTNGCKMQMPIRFTSGSQECQHQLNHINVRAPKGENWIVFIVRFDEIVVHWLQLYKMLRVC